MTFDLTRRLTAEALGTGLLVATVVGSGIMADKLAGGNVALALLGNTLPTGAILVVLILGLAPISGAHFNPAVSLVMALTGGLPWRDLAAYAVAQVVGGCLGTLAAHGMFELPLLQLAAKARTGPAQWFAEFVATFGLLVTILAVVRFPTDQINLTAKASRIMPVAGGAFEPCDNAQAVVAAGSLLVVAADVVQAANDKQQLAPMLGKIDTLPAELGRPETLLADSGYFSAANVTVCQA